MIQLQLKDIQDISLEIMKEFHLFCVKNGLKYSLAYGTLLGAVRHKGFIPWDDDVDVFMPRPDYNRFVTTYRDNDKFACFADERKNSYLAYARLADMKKTYVKPASIWTDKETGVWIDIFPLDGVESDKNAFIKSTKHVAKVCRKVCISREAMGDFSYCASINKKLKLIPKKILYHNSVYRYLHEHLSICHRFDFESSEYISNMSRFGSMKVYLPKYFIDTIIELPFEDCSFYSMAEYDKYLRMNFGDYMKLPPKDQRITHDMHHYYWK